MATDHSASSSATDAATRAELRADKHLVRAAACGLRTSATQGTYGGLRRPEYAYALASVLDLFELRWVDQDGPVRDEVRRCCRVLLDPSAVDQPDPENPTH